ncbi:MAG TPA: hypothetical protein VNH63_05095 [Gemmatimonadales bacterium]|nr:hypothetical protein [Gemmatimonadales bacterium]
MTRRWGRIVLLAVLGAAVAAACSDGAGPARAPRPFLMGFSAFPPRLDSSIVIPAINYWIPHADAAIMHVSPPWTALINGVSAAAAVDDVEVPLANYYRAKGLALVFTVDATDGLNRAAEAPELVALGRSVTDTAIQRLYRQWVTAIATHLHPDYLGLVAETNLIRAAAPDSVYQAVRVMANAAADDVQVAAVPTTLYVSVQVEVAWGRLAGPAGYQGIAQDLTDFPFVQAIGLSSYPYLAGFAVPESLPLDYYARIGHDAALPVLVVEGGWPSISVGAVASSPALQRRYIVRQGQLLDSARARGVFQLTFYDLDTTGANLPPSSILGLFTHLGLADSAMHPKTALSAWDALRARPYSPP